MRIPSDGLAAAAAASSGPAAAAPSSASYLDPFVYLFTKGGKFQTGDWSSLIGIVTAICGNILISVALNTQRYAHIKLNEQQRTRERLLKRARKRQRQLQQGGYSDEGYGTSSPSSVGKDPPVQNGGAATNSRYRDDPNEDDDATEDQPLLMSASVHSDATETHDGSERDGSRGGSGANDREEDGEAARKSYLKSPYWWAGIVMMTVGEAGNFLAYGFAPASIVSPLGVVALISNCVIAPFFLKEDFRKRDFLGVVIAVGGAVTVVLSANDSNPKLGPKEIWKLIGTWEFETYLGITVALICGLMWASSRYGEKSIFIDLGLVGLFGGYTALSTKGVASMLSYTVFKALTFPITYLLVIVLVFTAVMQIKYVNRALKRFDATQVIPTQFVLFTLSVIIGSAVLYRDFEKESAENAGKFIGGCAMTFLGVYFITSARNKDEDDDEVLEEDEEAIRLATEGIYHDEPEAHANARPDTRRSSTAPQAHAISIIGYRPQSPGEGSIPEGTAHPHITRTSTSQSVSLIDGEVSEPASFAEPSPISQNPWILPNEQPSAARKSMQKLLRPLDKILPNSGADKKLPGTLKATTSEPILPTEADLQAERPHTPLNTSHDQVLLQPHTPDGSNLLARHSITDFIPGPFTSTLSSPLSAIVADSLRRGVDIKSLKPKRRRKLPSMPRPGGSLQPQRHNSDTDASPHLQTEGGVSGSVPRDDDTGGDSGRRNRIRSLSNTFGDLFRSKKRARRGSIDDAEEGIHGADPHNETERDS